MYAMIKKKRALQVSEGLSLHWRLPQCQKSHKEAELNSASNTPSSRARSSTDKAPYVTDFQHLRFYTEVLLKYLQALFDSKILSHEEINHFLCQTGINLDFSKPFSTIYSEVNKVFLQTSRLTYIRGRHQTKETVKMWGM